MWPKKKKPEPIVVPEKKVTFKNPWKVRLDGDDAPIEPPQEMDVEACAELAKSSCSTCYGRGMISTVNQKIVMSGRSRKRVPLTGVIEANCVSVCMCAMRGYKKLNAEKKISFWERHVGLEVQ